MGRNPEWFEQQRARGICYICKHTMPDHDDRRAHTDCHRLQQRGHTYAQIRAMVEQDLMRRALNPTEPRRRWR